MQWSDYIQPCYISFLSILSQAITTTIIGTHMKNCQCFLLKRTTYLPEFAVKVKSQNVLRALHLGLLHACFLQFLSYLLLATVTVKTVS